MLACESPSLIWQQKRSVSTESSPASPNSTSISIFGQYLRTSPTTCAMRGPMSLQASSLTPSGPHENTFSKWMLKIYSVEWPSLRGITILRVPPILVASWTKTRPLRAERALSTPGCPFGQNYTVRYFSSAIFSTLNSDSSSGLKVWIFMHRLFPSAYIPSLRYSRIRSSSLQLAMNSTVLINPDSENLVNSSSFCMKMGKTNSTSSLELTGITILMFMTSRQRILKKYSRSLAILSLFLVCMLTYQAMLLLKNRDFSVRYSKYRSPRSPRIQSLKLPSLMLFSARTALNSLHCSSSCTRNITVSSLRWIEPKERTTILNLSLMMCTFWRSAERESIPGHSSCRARRPGAGRAREGTSRKLLSMRWQSSSMLCSAVPSSQRQWTEATPPTLPPRAASSTSEMSLRSGAQKAMKTAASNSSLKMVTGWQARLRLARNCCSLFLN